jgi:hypothetical protein
MVRYRTHCKQFFVMKPKTAEKSDSTEPKRQNESTRERVLEAAFTLFCEHGFSDDGREQHANGDQRSRVIFEATDPPEDSSTVHLGEVRFAETLSSVF